MGVTRTLPLLVVLGWAGTLCGLALWGIFLGFLVPSNLSGGGLLPEVSSRNPLGTWIFYLGIVSTSVLASLVLSDFGKAVISFFGSYLLAGLLTFVALSLPDLTGANYDPYNVLVGLATSITLTAFFPIPLAVGLFGTVLGSVLAERYL